MWIVGWCNSTATHYNILNSRFRLHATNRARERVILRRLFRLRLLRLPRSYALMLMIHMVKCAEHLHVHLKVSRRASSENLRFLPIHWALAINASRRALLTGALNSRDVLVHALTLSDFARALWTKRFALVNESALFTVSALVNMFTLLNISTLVDMSALVDMSTLVYIIHIDYLRLMLRYFNIPGLLLLLEWEIAGVFTWIASRARLLRPEPRCIEGLWRGILMSLGSRELICIHRLEQELLYIIELCCRQLWDIQ